MKTNTGHFARKMIKLTHIRQNFFFKNNKLTLLIFDSGEYITSFDGSLLCSRSLFFIAHGLSIILGHMREVSNLTKYFPLLFSRCEPWRIILTNCHGITRRGDQPFIQKPSASYYHVWSLTRFYVVGFSQSRIGEKMFLFLPKTQLRFASVVFDTCPGTLVSSATHLTLSLFSL